MKDVRLPAADLPRLTRSVVACIAAILDLQTHEVPAPSADHPEPWTFWHLWLSQRGLGLVPVVDPQNFGWPGPWLALLDPNDQGGPAGVIAFGSPPGIAWDPLGLAASFDGVQGGYVIAPADVAEWAPARMSSPRTSGAVVAIALAGDAEAPMSLVKEAVARAGRGLEGDRYFRGEGTFSGRPGQGRDLTLIEAEVLERSTHRRPYTFEETRRNVITRGIDLNALTGKRFVIGGVQCFGQRLCEPCAHLERLTQPGTLRDLVHRGGLRADICSDGVIRVGDRVRAV